ncbi:unnamed protein product [Pedinophyceae sp. YPF-701]|nr:unnamed protein product [Pedinophyceae sp. YPF-701]
MAFQGKAEPGKTKVGFVGLGIMGYAMCKRLVEAGYDVTVYNRDSSKTKPLVDIGAKAAPTARECAAASDVTFGIVSDPEAALAVASGPDGVAAGMSTGKGYVDASTVDADTSRAVGELVNKAGGVYLEAPVSGSKGPAEQGALIFLCAGDKALFDFVENGPLDVMGKASFHLADDVGAGAHMKLVVNGVMGSMMASFAEGMALAEKTGLKKETMVEVLGLGAMACPLFALKGPAMAKGQFPTAFPLKHQQKDLRLALLLADEVSQQMPVTAAANQLYVKARHQGMADQDMSAVMVAVDPDESYSDDVEA